MNSGYEGCYLRGYLLKPRKGCSITEERTIAIRKHMEQIHTFMFMWRVPFDDLSINTMLNDGE